MHTGEPTVGDEGYHGFGVHRAARIMAAGHGGQVLASQATCSVLEDDELPGIRLRELGEYRLKDLDRPERIYQLDVEGLPQEFPALRTADAPTAYTGLEEDLEEAARAAVWQARFWTRGRLAAGVAGLLVAAGLATVLALVLGGPAQALSHVDANAVGLINPSTNRIAGQVEVGATPSHLAVGEGAVWVTNAGEGTVSRIDPLKEDVVQTITVGSSPSGITVGNGAVWVANSLDGTVSRIAPDTNSVVQTIDVGNGPVGAAFGARSVWVANTGDNTISKIDAQSGTVTKTLKTGATELAFGAGALWASDRAANRVSRIDPASGSVAQTIAVGNGPTGLAFGDGAAWVANSLDGTVSRIDPATNSVNATIPVGDGPSAVAVGAGGVWVSNEFSGTVARIDPQQNQVVQRIDVGNRPRGVAVANGDVLVSVLQSGAGHRGGTLRVRTSLDPESIDPVVDLGDPFSETVLRMTNDGLVAYNQAGGLEGTQLVPDLAVSLPSPTEDGRTFTFRLRPNIRFSNGRPVRASDFRATAERTFKIEPESYGQIVGAARCKKTPRRCDLSHGIVADDAARTITFHLAEPDPEFLYVLAGEKAFVLPAGTPAKEAGTHPLPATGPYMIARYRRKHVLRLVRNPHFHEWSKAAQPDGYPDEIVFEIGGTPDEQVDDVIRGKADLFSSALSHAPPSKDRLAALKTRYASQVHTNPETVLIALFLNTRLAPFDRLDVRRALNYAADRAAAVEAAGGPDLAQAACQIWPPGFPGHRPYCPYSAGTTTRGTWTAPNLEKALALVARSGTRGMKVTVWSWAGLGGFGPYAVKLLRSLGYRASMKVRGGLDYFRVVSDSRTKAQIGTLPWGPDNPGPSGFLPGTCASFLPRNPRNSNVAQFCEPRIDRLVEKALSEQVTNPNAARRLWERIDREITDQALWMPLVNPKTVDVLSKRVGNYQYGVLIDQLWVK